MDNNKKKRSIDQVAFLFLPILKFWGTMAFVLTHLTIQEHSYTVQDEGEINFTRYWGVFMNRCIGYCWGIKGVLYGPGSAGTGRNIGAQRGVVFFACL